MRAAAVLAILCALFCAVASAEDLSADLEALEDMLPEISSEEDIPSAEESEESEEEDDDEDNTADTADLDESDDGDSEDDSEDDTESEDETSSSEESEEENGEECAMVQSCTRVRRCHRAHPRAAPRCHRVRRCHHVRRCGRAAHFPASSQLRRVERLAHTFLHSPKCGSKLCAPGFVCREGKCLMLQRVQCATGHLVFHVAKGEWECDQGSQFCPKHHHLRKGVCERTSCSKGWKLGSDGKCARAAFQKKIPVALNVPVPKKRYL